MKVKELISKLQELDPEKNIWQEYDNMYDEPSIGVASDADAFMGAEEGVKEGDYLL